MSRPLLSVQNKIVVVTGGLGQLGRQFALALSAAGARVAVFDRRVSPRVVAERFGARRAHPRLLFAAVDVATRASITRGLRAVIRRWGVPHALINAAAIDVPPHSHNGESGPFETYPEPAWQAALDTNLNGVVRCCQVIGGAMARAGRGSIVNIGSIYGVVSPDQRVYASPRAQGAPFFKPAVYTATKSGLYGLTRYLATYWAPRHVRVNILTLGGVLNGQSRSFLDAYCARVPMGRMAREDEYNGAVAFLVSDASSYMTGSQMVLDGGWTAW